jgi:hypothetical protein
MALETAASAIAAARCDHENACNQIGNGRAYTTADACMAELTASAMADLKTHPCPSGIDSNVVAKCAGMLKQESCHPLSMLSRMYTCRPANLCVQADTVRFTEEDIYGE